METHSTVLSSELAVTLTYLPMSDSPKVSAPVSASTPSASASHALPSSLVYQARVSLASLGRSEVVQLLEPGIFTLGVSTVPTLSVLVVASAGAMLASLYWPAGVTGPTGSTLVVPP